MNVIEIKNAVKSYDKFSLNIENLEIPKGYITGIIGRNGAGKTTLIKSILGITEHDSGEIKIFGKTMKGNERELKNKIGVMWGHSGFYAGVTLKRMTKMIKRFYSDWDETAYKGYIEKFELDESKKYKELSMGMCAKYSIAIALSHNAELIIMDEPSSGLDPIAREELMDIFSELIAEKEITIVISTHITSDLDRMADYIVMINDGNVLLNMPKDELIETHRIVKGGKDELTDEVKKRLISYKISAYNFEGLTSKPDYMRSNYRNFVYEKPLIEDIMRFMDRSENNA